MTKTELIELAKECGMAFGDGCGNVSIYGNVSELSDYTNAIIEMCASASDTYRSKTGIGCSHTKDVAESIRELKVKE